MDFLKEAEKVWETGLKKAERIGGSFTIICSELNLLGWPNSPVTGSRDSGGRPGFEGC